MVLVDQIQEPLQKLLALLFRDPIDVFHVPANREDALPPSDRVSTHHWMDSLENAANVLRRTTLLVVEAETVLLSRLLEVWLLKGDSKGLKELLVRRR